MTPEIQKLREESQTLADILGAIELEIVAVPDWDQPSDSSYLTAEDRANPDIMSNVQAMASTNALIRWFGRDREGFVGLWQGPQRRPLAGCPVVRLDTEGQYELIASTVADYVALSVDDELFEHARLALAGAGFQVEASREAAWKAVESFDKPNDFRNGLYNEARKGRGLEPIE